MKIVIGSICKQGGREYNQDYIETSVLENNACLVVCDGLGSYVGSEVASRLCAQKIISSYEQTLKTDALHASLPDFTKGYIKSAHEYVVRHKEQTPSIKNSCTTVACVITDGKNTSLCHIGDTRIYFFRGGKLSFQSKDHSLSQLAVESGKILLRDVRNHIDQNKLTRVVGGDYYIEPDCENSLSPLQSGDAFIICTDGFWEYVFEEEMESDLSSSEAPDEAISKMEQRLLTRINKYNDNYSAIVAMIK